MYKLTPDRANHRLQVEFVDTYADIDPEQLSRDLRAGVLGVKGSKVYFDLLVDYTSVMVMPKNNTGGARAEVEWCIANGLRKSANVVNSALAKLQLARLQQDDRFRNFTSRAKASEWLDLPD